MRYVSFIILFCVCLMHYSYAQDRQYSFHNLGEKDGLRNNIVFCLLKDNHGILWVGTQNGLNRFDGSHFYTFKKNRETNSLPNNTIQCLTEDKNGNIWGGTDNGIFRYSPSEDKFITFNAQKGARDNIISNIVCDRAGDIYASNSTELYKFNKLKNEFQLLTALTNGLDSVGGYFIGKNRIQKDEANNGFWISSKVGLLFYDLGKGVLTGHFNSINSPLFAKRNTSALSKFTNGYFWFFDNQTKEIISFDPTSKQILQKINIEKKYPESKASTIFEDSQHRLWVSNWNYELLVIDLANNNKITKIESKDGNNYTVAANFFWAAFEDENASVWLGTPGGLSICTPGKYFYNACQLPSKIPLLQSTTVYLTEEDPSDKSWWILSGNNIVIHYYPSSGKFEPYYLKDFVPDKNGQRPQNIYTLKFFNGSVVITCFAGVWQLKPHAKTFTPMNFLPPEYGNFVITNFVQTDSVMYFTDGERMLKWHLNLQSGTWITYKNDNFKTKERPDFSHLLYKNKHEFYWTCSKNYIGRIGPDNDIESIKLIQNDTVEAGGYFHTADMDNEGNIWVANKGVGIYRYQPQLKKINYWTELDGLVDNHLHSIKADDRGNIWTMYYNKGSVFNPSKNNFINFSIPYSENNLNYYNNLTKRMDGVIMGNVGNDIFEFFPDALRITPVKKTPELSVVTISGKDYFVTSTQNLHLDPNQNSLRFKFGLLVDASIFPHDFIYMLEGSDKEWMKSSINNEANYNNLSPGNYTFRLIAKGRNDAWQTAEKSINITIKTPFYKTNWFLLIVLLIAIGLIYYFYRYRMAQKEMFFELESKSQLLEKEKTMVMYESLKQQLNPHFLFNSLTSLSGLIETDQELAGNFLEQMSGIYRYILKNGDNETVTIKDEIQFVKLYINLQKTRFKNGLKVIIDIPDEFLHYKIAPVTLQNLIENAIKHNVIDVDVPLVIHIYIENEYLVVTNNLQKKRVVENSNNKGLSQFKTLYKYLSDKPIIIQETKADFTIKIPLI